MLVSPTVEKRYYRTGDIARILAISSGKANQIMHMFEEQGQLFREGRLMRVRIDVFEQWLNERGNKRHASG